VYWDKSFLETAYPAPGDGISIDDKRKSPKYSLDMAKFIYSYEGYNGDGLYSNYERFRENTLYGKAKQSKDRYEDKKDPLDPVIEKVESSDGESYRATAETKRRGYGNIDYKILHVLPKFRSVYVGRMSKVKTDIVARSQDPLTKAEKETKKNRIWINKYLIDDPNYAALIKQTQGAEEQFIPASREELDIVFSGDKVDYEIAIENAIRNDFDQSDWDEINEKLHGSMFDNNRCATETVVDKLTMQTRQEYVDIESVIIQHSRFNDYRNAEFCARFVPYTVAEFRSENPQLSEGKIRELINNYLGSKWINDTPSGFMLDGADVYSDTGNCNYNNFYLPVLKCYWKTVDTHLKKGSKDVEIKGKVRKSELKSGKIFEKDSKYYKKVPIDVKDVEVQMVYSCMWIIGSEYVWKYGAMEDQIRDNKGVKLPITYYRVDGDSLNERCQRPVDDIVLNELTFQDALTSAAKQGYLFDWESAVATANEIDGMNPLDLMAIRRRGDGDIYMKFGLDSDFGSIAKGGYQGLPIQKLEGGIGTQLDEYIRILATKLQQIQSLTGIVGEQAAEVVKGDDTAYQAQLRATASSDATNVYFKAVDRIKGRSSQSAAYRIQNLISYNKDSYEAYSKIIGKQGCDAIKEMEKRNESPSELGILIIAQPTDQEIAEINMWIQQGLAGGKNGNASITMGDAFMITEMLKNGTSVKEIKKFMLYRENQRNREQQQQAAEQQQVQGQVMQQAEQQKQKFEMDKIFAKAKADIMVKKTEAMLKVMEIAEQGKIDMQLELVEQRFDLMIKKIEMEAQDREDRRQRQVA
jgi:hypothetical protein